MRHPPPTASFLMFASALGVAPMAGGGYWPPTRRPRRPKPKRRQNKCPTRDHRRRSVVIDGPPVPSPGYGGIIPILGKDGKPTARKVFTIYLPPTNRTDAARRPVTFFLCFNGASSSSSGCTWCLRTASREFAGDGTTPPRPPAG